MPSPMTKAGVPLDQRIQTGIFHAAHEPLGIEADGTGGGDDAIEAEGPSAPSNSPSIAS